MEIRFAEAGDAILFFQILNDQPPSEAEWFERALLDSRVLFAELDENPIGFISFEIKDWIGNSVPAVTDIFVNEPFRRQGISRALLAFLENHLRGLGYKTIWGFVSDTETRLKAWLHWLDFFELSSAGEVENIEMGDLSEIVFKPGTGFFVFRKDLQ